MYKQNFEMGKDNNETDGEKAKTAEVARMVCSQAAMYVTAYLYVVFQY